MIQTPFDIRSTFFKIFFTVWQVINWNIPPLYEDLAKYVIQTYSKCMRRGICNENCQGNNVNMASKGSQGGVAGRRAKEVCQCQCAAWKCKFCLLFPPLPLLQCQQPSAKNNKIARKWNWNGSHANAKWKSMKSAGKSEFLGKIKILNAFPYTQRRRVWQFRDLLWFNQDSVEMKEFKKFNYKKTYTFYISSWKIVKFFIKNKIFMTDNKD